MCTWQIAIKFVLICVQAFFFLILHSVTAESSRVKIHLVTGKQQ